MSHARTPRTLSAPIRVSVVIPTYNGRQLLVRTLPSVCAALSPADEIIVVDDASTDDSVEWLHQQAPQWQAQFGGTVTILPLAENQRFAQAMNAGVARARGKYLFCLNNDVTLTQTVVERLLAVFQRSDERVFGVGCLEVEAAPPQHAAALRQAPTVSQLQKNALQIGGKNRVWFAEGVFHHARATEWSAGPTAWVSGGSGLFDRKKFIQLGGFDPVFAPAYWEDVDLALRARRRGWQMLFCPEAVVYHHHESTNAQTFTNTQLQRVSWHNAHRATQRNGTFWQRIANVLWRPLWWWRTRKLWTHRVVAFPALAVFAIALVTFGLRFFALGSVPHGLGWDEAAIGYNGYAVLTTRRDEWLMRFPISFRSFGDYKAPLAIYLNGVSTWVWGMHPFGIRLPFALAGMLTVLGVVVLAQQVLPRAWRSQHVAGWSLRDIAVAVIAFVAATSVWQVHYSRIAFESGMSLGFVVWGVIAWEKLRLAWLTRTLVPFRARWWREAMWLVLGVVAGVAAMYTYHSAKIVAPLVMAGWAVWRWSLVRQHLRWWVGAGCLWLLLMAPMGLDTLRGQGGTRFEQSSLFGLHLSAIELATRLVTNTLDHLDPAFLVGGKTTTFRHGDGRWGILYPTEAFVLAIAIIGSVGRFWWQRRMMARSQPQGDRSAVGERVDRYETQSTERALLLWLLWWVLVGVLPAIIGRETPHSNRALLAWAPLMMLVGVGVVQIAQWLQTLPQHLKGSKQEDQLPAKTFLGTLLLLHVFFVSATVSNYYTSYASVSTHDFQDGSLEAARIAVAEQGNFEKVLFTSKYGQPYIFVLMAAKTNPIWYHAGSLSQYEFSDRISVSDRDRSDALVIATPEELPPLKEDQLIRGADGSVRFVIARIKRK